MSEVNDYKEDGIVCLFHFHRSALYSDDIKKGNKMNLSVTFLLSDLTLNVATAQGYGLLTVIHRPRIF
jgi:hypothetical protein